MRILANFFLFLLISLNIKQTIKANNMESVYKILTVSEWQKFQSQGEYEGSLVDIKDGFIHLSPRDKINRVMSKYYNQETKVYILKFSESHFLNLLKWELASDNNLYPHLYNRPLYLKEVEEIKTADPKIGI
ncbi:MAG: DUF952 domain-containing protein [Pseudobdellovibrio sp.]